MINKIRITGGGMGIRKTPILSRRKESTALYRSPSIRTTDKKKPKQQTV